MASNRRAPGFRFKASARLQRLLGRELMPDDISAFEELVKNAYDSNATEVTISIVRKSPDHDGEIEIRDDGLGLSRSEFQRVWMRAGYSEKAGQPLPETGRIQVGEKGIGRFAADRLGAHLEVITKPAKARAALRVRIDWTKFDNKKRLLDEIPVPYDTVNEELLPQGKSGTILRITRLRADWTDTDIAGLRRRLAQLLNPYDKGQQFKIALTAPSPKLSGRVLPSEIRGADLEWDVTRSAQGRVRVRRRARIGRDSAEMSEWSSELVTLDDKLPPESDFGPVSGRFYFFVDRRPKKEEIGDAEPGVAIYRDGIRVEPAGSSTADWLGLLEKRAKRAGHMPLVPNRLFGFVQITRGDNAGIQDATNRRAFVDAPQLSAFKSFLKDRLREFEKLVEEEVSKPKWERSRQVKSRTLLQAQHQTLSIMSMSLAHELRQPLQSIRTAAENISGYLRLNNVILEPVDSATEAIERGVVRIDRHIQFLKAIGSGREESEAFDATSAIKEVVDALHDYAAARRIALKVSFGTRVPVRTNNPTFLATASNLVLNACQAIEGMSDGEPHVIEFGVKVKSDRVDVIVSDDGPGIPEANRARLFKRQTTTKQGGMGVGLIVWQQALQMFGGDLKCTKYENPTTFVMSIPRERGNDPSLTS
jgi:signal transduction histidine kinase